MMVLGLASPSYLKGLVNSWSPYDGGRSHCPESPKDGYYNGRIFRCFRQKILRMDLLLFGLESVPTKGKILWRIRVVKLPRGRNESAWGYFFL